jgi:hypothetical protein
MTQFNIMMVDANEIEVAGDDAAGDAIIIFADEDAFATIYLDQNEKLQAGFNDEAIVNIFESLRAGENTDDIASSIYRWVDHAKQAYTMARYQN